MGKRERQQMRMEQMPSVFRTRISFISKSLKVVKIRLSACLAMLSPTLNIITGHFAKILIIFTLLGTRAEVMKLALTNFMLVFTQVPFRTFFHNTKGTLVLLTGGPDDVNKLPNFSKSTQAVSEPPKKPKHLHRSSIRKSKR